MRTAGLRRSDVQGAVERIEDLIDEAGIGIASSPDIDLDQYRPADQRISIIVRRYKNVSPRTLRHDIAAIESIRELREGQKARKLQDSKALFLSSDVRLSRASFDGLGHKRRGTVAEVVHDGTLASILWLRSPSASPLLRAIVAAHSKNLFVDRRVWARFLEVVQSLKEQGEVHDEDLADLLYRDYVSTVLVDIDANNVNQVNEQFILQEVEKARQARLRRRAKDIEALEEEHKVKLRAVGEGIEAAWIQRIQGELEGIEIDCTRRASRLAFGLSTLATAAYAAVVSVLSCLISKAPMVPWANGLAFAAAFAAPGSLIVLLWKSGRRWLGKHVFDYLYAHNRERSRLEKILSSPSSIEPNQSRTPSVDGPR